MFNGIFIAAANNAKAMEAELAARRATATASETSRQSEFIKEDIDKLYMITQALWELLKAECGYTDDTLMKKITEIDLSDGRLDGKVAKKERPNCPSCGRKMGRLQTCLYCGAMATRCPFDR